MKHKMVVIVLLMISFIFGVFVNNFTIKAESWRYYSQFKNVLSEISDKTMTSNMSEDQWKKEYDGWYNHTAYSDIVIGYNGVLEYCADDISINDVIAPLNGELVSGIYIMTNNADTFCTISINFDDANHDSGTIFMSGIIGTSPINETETSASFKGKIIKNYIHDADQNTWSVFRTNSDGEEYDSGILLTINEDGTVNSYTPSNIATDGDYADSRIFDGDYNLTYPTSN